MDSKADRRAAALLAMKGLVNAWKGGMRDFAARSREIGAIFEITGTPPGTVEIVSVSKVRDLD